MTCMVRRAGISTKVPFPKVSHILRKELKKRGIWRKHHKYTDGDQYYQLGETPGYILQEQGEAYQKAMQTSERQFIKNLKDSIR